MPGMGSSVVRVHATYDDYSDVIEQSTGCQSEASRLGSSAAGRPTGAERTAWHRAIGSGRGPRPRRARLAGLAGPPAEGTRPMLLRMLFTASPARAAAVGKRLLALIKAVKAEGAERRGARRRGPRAGEERWALTIGLAPSWPRRRGGAE